ncbi:D-glycerate dehydrogenase [Aneurinibacillus sp. Ricciae_BoGa-3]|uniref:2-hydroxyacid dehydrogenase n=1 Tax=Aneurinibacillus sp. Ricciae_BoGa-3 TaxID=3022697 RepID=UPI002341533A|nr:D-glycerate dehydrogenase [Aneurinibacillus sp. Ricciae_BoGa-3]WCK53232.1 D-glycerate dehydrogenase [Aneurinibacillus sp. Ricciae_BoGa-3]
MRPKVFIARPIPFEVEAYIGEYCDYRKWDSTESIPVEQLMEEIRDVDGLLTSGTPINQALLDQAVNLKVVSNISVGYNNFNIEAMKAKGVMGTHTPDVLDETVADLVFALMLSAARRVPELDKLVKGGEWKAGSDTRLFGVDVHHKTAGIIGMGRIGQAIARRAKFGFSMEVLYYNRSRKPEAEEKLGVQYAGLEELLKKSDFVILMTPLTPQTERFIGREQFALMKRDAIFINASRGQTVDESALIEALQAGIIQAAGLDVFAQEPVNLDNSLLQMANVVTLPHIGSATAQTRADIAMMAAENLVKAVRGEIPPNLVPELKPY